jgi:hypothetical protein
MPLSDKTIQAAKAGDKDEKLIDGGGLRLVVTTSGSKLWRIKYRFDGKERLHSLSDYPTVSLKAARQALADLKAQLKDGVDPSAKRKEQKQATTAAGLNSFETIAGEWWFTGR